MLFFLVKKKEKNKSIKIFNKIKSKDEASFKSVITDDLLDKIEELSRDSDKRKGKKEKNKQRSMFREILQTLEVISKKIKKQK